MAAESVEEAQADAFDSLVTLPGSQAGQISASQITLASKAFLCLLITDQITSRKHLSGRAEGDGEGGTTMGVSAGGPAASQQIHWRCRQPENMEKEIGTESLPILRQSTTRGWYGAMDGLSTPSTIPVIL